MTLARNIMRGLVIAAVAAVQPLTDVLAAAIAPHEATYTMSLLEAEAGAETSVEGLYLVRIESSCESNRITTYLDVRFSNLNGRPATVEDSYSITESLDSRRLNFRSEQSVNGQTVQRIAGLAFKDDAGGRVGFEHPVEREDIKLPPGTVFPYEAVVATMRGIDGGEKGIRQVMFDPSIGDPVLVADLFIGRATALSSPPSGDAVLLEGQARRMLTTFYPLDATDVAPMSSAVVDIYPNGVSPRAVFDMGPVKVLAELAAVRKLDNPDCT